MTDPPGTPRAASLEVRSCPAMPASVGHDRAAMLDLLRRYDRPGPRYTSYPTAVEFHEGFGERAFTERLSAAAEHSGEPLSLYVHLPFCEERCSFCGCTVIVTKKRQVASRYLEYVEKEVALLANALKDRRRVVQYHWGGGTPTYLSPEQIVRLHGFVTRHFDVRPEGEIAIEVDPRVTSEEQLETLRGLGFNRLSIGVQDFDPDVQRAVNRVQGEALTQSTIDTARNMGFEAVNIDLIYGLPLQTVASFGQSVQAVIEMRPSRVALYSFAHVPWMRGNQKRIRPEDMPSPDVKLGLFIDARERFLAAGYRQIGMDHFALPADELARAAESGTLYRNFMGYTTRAAPDMLGVGVSAIGEIDSAYVQNTKKLTAYYEALDAGRFPVERGYELEADDRLRRHVITSIMCNFRLDIAEVERRFEIDFARYFAVEREELAAGPIRHGFLHMDDNYLEVTPLGRLFVRNICMVFDRYLRSKAGLDKPVFSRTI